MIKIPPFGGFLVVSVSGKCLVAEYIKQNFN